MLNKSYVCRRTIPSFLRKPKVRDKFLLKVSLERPDPIVSRVALNGSPGAVGLSLNISVGSGYSKLSVAGCDTNLGTFGQSEASWINASLTLMTDSRDVR
jgi:hypothetical protein